MACNYRISVRTSDGDKKEVEFDEFEDARRQWEQSQETPPETVWTEIRSERQELSRVLTNSSGDEVGIIMVGERYVMETASGARMILDFDRS